MFENTVECTIYAGQGGKKFSEMHIHQMDAQFDVGLLVQNSQTHPTFNFEKLINDSKKMIYETQNEHNDAKTFILTQRNTKKCPKIR